MPDPDCSKFDNSGATARTTGWPPLARPKPARPAQVMAHRSAPRAQAMRLRRRPAARPGAGKIPVGAGAPGGWGVKAAFRLLSSPFGASVHSRTSEQRAQPSLRQLHIGKFTCLSVGITSGWELPAGGDYQRAGGLRWIVIVRFSIVTLSLMARRIA